MVIDSNKKDQFIRLIEATLSELEDLSIAYTDDVVLKTYHGILVSYYQNNLDDLEAIMIALTSKLNSSDRSLDELRLLKHILNLRIAIRKNSVRKFLINNLLDAHQTLSVESQSIWAGEIYILIAFALGEVQDFRESINFYELAIFHLDKMHARKKSLRAKQNLIATLESLNSMAAG